MNKNITLLAIFICTLVFMSFLGDRKQKTKKIIFFGDSITQAGVQPGGYISLMRNNLEKAGTDGYELIGAGIGGNKIYDLYLRMKEDVLSKSPDVVVIYVGVNDVWHKSLSGTGTDPDKFERFYRAVISDLQASNSKVVVCTPAVIGEKKDCTNSQDGDLNKYSNIIRKIAADMNLQVCDLRSIFLNYEQQNNEQNADRGILTTDGVHLNEKGNSLVAEKMWDILKTM